MNSEDLPPEQRRGIETIDVNDTVILVRANIETVAQAFSWSRQAYIWQRDVYQREIEIVGHSFVIFQFRGQPWTLIKWLYVFLTPQKIITPEDAKTLSDLLSTRSIYYRISDTGGTLAYQIYDRGTLVEKLFHEEDTETEFESQLRSLQSEYIDNSYNFVYDIFVEQDIYIPMCFCLETYEVGEKTILEAEGIEAENLERVDYIAIK
jgi:hypothetical protein